MAEDISEGGLVIGKGSNSGCNERDNALVHFEDIKVGGKSDSPYT